MPLRLLALGLVLLLMEGGAVAAEPRAPPPKNADEPDEQGLQLGARTGYAIPFGKLDGASKNISDTIHGQIPIWLDAGYRVSPNFVVGLYGQVGFLLPACPSGVSCSGTDIRFGAQIAYHLAPREPTDLWFGLGAGYEFFNITASSGTAGLSASANGFEFAHLHMGVAFKLSERAKIGPFVSFSVGQIANESAGSISTSNFPSAIHMWLFPGLNFIGDL